MFLILFSFVAFTKEKEINITDSFIGQWDVRRLELDEEFNQDYTTESYQLNITASGENFVGSLKRTDNAGKFPFAQIQLVKKSDFVYSLLYSTDESEFKEFCAPLTFSTGFENLIQTFGYFNSSTSFAFNFLTSGQIEITLYNSVDNSISFYHLYHPVLPSKPPITSFQLLLPLIPIFMMMYNREKSRQQEIQRKNRLSRSNNQNSRPNKKD